MQNVVKLFYSPNQNTIINEGKGYLQKQDMHIIVF